MHPPATTESQIGHVLHLTTHSRPVLKIGSQGTVVAELQKLLAHWQIYTHPEAVFDIQLENAVKAFQCRVFLKEDGIVGPQTWQALYTGAPIDMPVLQKGSSGETVRLLQKALQAVGCCPIVLDGIFGSSTEAAVRRFQRQRGLVVDGVVGCCTWRALSRIPR